MHIVSHMPEDIWYRVAQYLSYHEFIKYPEIFPRNLRRKRYVAHARRLIIHKFSHLLNAKYTYPGTFRQVLIPPPCCIAGCRWRCCTRFDGEKVYLISPYCHHHTFPYLSTPHWCWSPPRLTRNHFAWDEWDGDFEFERYYRDNHGRHMSEKVKCEPLYTHKGLNEFSKWGSLINNMQLRVNDRLSYRYISCFPENTS